MDDFLGSDVSAALARAEEILRGFLKAVLDPWVFVQIAVILLGLAAGNFLGARIERALEPRVRAVQGRRRLLRFLALLLRRTRWIVTGLLLGAAFLVMREATLPSRSTIVGIAATLIAAWVVIAIVSRLIRHPIIARLVAWLAWIFVALRVIDAADDVARGLDAAALQFGAVRISLYDIAQATLVVVVLFWVAQLAGNFLERRVAASADLTPSLKVLIGKLGRIVLLVTALAVGLAALGIDLTAFTVFTGALGVGIGIGLQKVVSNFVSGIVILLDKSIKPGDTISLGDTYGWVKELRARFVSVITRDGHSYLIPNEDFITQRMVSWSFTETLVRLDVDFGVAYSSDPHLVRRTAVEAAGTVERVQERPKPVCHLTKLNDFTLDFILRFWVLDPQNGVTNVRGAVLLAVWDAFKVAGIEFAFPQRELVLKKPVDVRLQSALGGDEEPDLPL